MNSINLFGQEIPISYDENGLPVANVRVSVNIETWPIFAILIGVALTVIILRRID